ncbi:glycosyltransferase [Glutamicibacter ardleyensis]|nr:glycosyltransferase [Glutamicibacter ardleyensis]
MSELENELHFTRSFKGDLEAQKQKLRILLAEYKELEDRCAEIEDNTKSILRDQRDHEAALQASFEDSINEAKLEFEIKEKEIESNSLSNYKNNELARVAKVGTPSPVFSGTFRLTPNSYFGSLHHKDIRIIERIALNQGSLESRQAIALAASNLNLSLEELLIIVRGFRENLFDRNAIQVAKDWNIRSLLSLARVLTDQNLLPSDKADAVAIYEFALALFGPGRIDVRARYLFIETIQELQDFDRGLKLRELFNFADTDKVQDVLLQCNMDMILHKDEQKWLNNLNELYLEDKLAPLSLDNHDNNEILLDRLSVHAKSVDEGPLVSVLMPTHNGSAWIKTAINSVLRQSWTNLELIIVDDHSEEEHWNYLTEFALRDNRIKTFRMESNQGAYRVRNFAFAQAKGEFVTVHDDDDWSHPQKIELQVNQLINNEDLPGNMSFQTRIDDQDQFLRINDNPSFNQKNYSSMMFRKNMVEDCGGWDDINRAADAEFHDRVQLLTKNKIAFVQTAPLSFMRARTGSLTSGEIRRGALDFARQSFGLLYGNWHRKLVENDSSTESATESLDPKHRHYQVPANMRAGRRHDRHEKFDVVFLTDYRFPGGNSSLIAEEIDATAKAGLNVAVVHVASPVLRANHVFNDRVHTIISEHSVPVLSLTDTFETDLLVIRNPTVLQFLDNFTTSIHVSHVAVIANTAPMSANGKNFCYDIRDCLKNASKTFGTNAVLYPESPQTRKLLLALDPTAETAQIDWTGFIDTELFAHSNKNKNSRPIVGRHSRDHQLKWPENRNDIEAAYVQPGIFDTLVLGGAGSVKEIIQFSSMPTVKVLEFGEQSPEEFLINVDFWVYMHHPDLVESFGMSIVEAMAAGCIVVLPGYMEALFKDAAIYAEPADVKQIVEKYWTDTTKRNEQISRSLAFVRDNFSAASFLNRIHKILESTSEIS